MAATRFGVGIYRDTATWWLSSVSGACQSRSDMRWSMGTMLLTREEITTPSEEVVRIRRLGLLEVGYEVLSGFAPM